MHPSRPLKFGTTPPRTCRWSSHLVSAPAHSHFCMLARLLQFRTFHSAPRSFHLPPSASFVSSRRYAAFAPLSAGSNNSSRVILRQLQTGAARAFASEARAGGSTKHRAAIMHASPIGGGNSCGESKLIYRSPITLIKIFRSLAMVQTAGCILGCCSMLWLVRRPRPRARGFLPSRLPALAAQPHHRQRRHETSGARPLRRLFWDSRCQDHRRAGQAPCQHGARAAVPPASSLQCFGFGFGAAARRGH